MKKPVKRKGAEKRPFDVKEKRFITPANDVPGAGTYKLPSTLEIKDEARPLASYVSATEKGWDIVVGRDNPGIGEYDTQHFKTIGVQEFQGGAANNFALFTKSNQAVKRAPAMPEKARFAPMK